MFDPAYSVWDVAWTPDKTSLVALVQSGKHPHVRQIIGLWTGAGAPVRIIDTLISLTPFRSIIMLDGNDGERVLTSELHADGM
jgi:hypothetical protein